MRVVNIKENNPNFEYAIYLLESAIHDARACGEKGLIVIHGYGSHGMGGDIKRSAIQTLTKLKSLGQIKDFVQGEHWCETNERAMAIQKQFPELILQQNLQALNSGVSVVLLF